MTYDQKVILLGTILIATSTVHSWVPDGFKLGLDLVWAAALATLGWLAFSKLAPPIPLRTWRQMYRAGYRWQYGYFARVGQQPTWRANHIELRETQWVPVGWREIGTDCYPWEPTLAFDSPWAAHCYAEVEQWGSL